MEVTHDRVSTSIVRDEQFEVVKELFYSFLGEYVNFKIFITVMNVY